MDPLPVPLTDQFTRVLVAFRTVAVHCAVPFTVTSDPLPEVEMQEAVMDGVTAVEVELPQELRNAIAAVRRRKERMRSQPALGRLPCKFGSSTRIPPPPRRCVPCAHPQPAGSQVITEMDQNHVPREA